MSRRLQSTWVAALLFLTGCATGSLREPSWSFRPSYAASNRPLRDAAQRVIESDVVTCLVIPIGVVGSFMTGFQNGAVLPEP